MTITTLILNTFGLVGILSTVVGGLVVVRATREARTAEVWKAEAEAQKARGDRLEADLSEIKERLKQIERKNQQLIQLLTAIDPALVAQRSGLE
ncbi:MULTISPECIES: hypothetical protein [unclassified Streptomyces]|uniref:hypothetical protein n=1 Tax=unclassified Streptomyces TaxID=2593676 RepID=UPI002010126D|nr:MULTISPECIES: hypothetical protein [unclassified Streptomyces]MCM1967784.1 hypothetical protein [Streptomyces sp. G1]UQI44623.1 hypothetical protein M1P56_09820 [Streptomyces sp. HU2014]